MSVTLIVVLVVEFAVVMFVVVPGLTFRWIERSVAPRIAAVVPAGATLLQDLRANGLGPTPRDRFQTRGNGALVLTGTGSCSSRWCPSAISRSRWPASLWVKPGKVHLGKSYGLNLLYVGFDGPTGPDSIAWFVRDLPAWLKALRSGPHQGVPARQAGGGSEAAPESP